MKLRHATLVLLFAGCALAQSRPMDTARSSITVHAYKAGLFSFAAHDHEIAAPIAYGSVTETDAMSVTLAVDTRQMKVLDRKLSASDRAEVQQTMLSNKVLNAEAYPQITFTSTEVHATGVGRWKVNGNLTLHGRTQPVLLEVTGGSGEYSGTCILQQSAFGIAPISVAGGTVRVKDAVRVEFRIFVK